MVRRIDEAAEKNRGNEAVGLAADQRVGLSFARGCAAVLAASICETTPIYRMPKRKVLSEIRRYNPLLFDCALKRSLGQRRATLHPVVFESRRLFELRSN
jgi:hypothetical protein